MAIGMYIHRAKNVRFASTYESNDNSVMLEIETEEGDVEITIYGLPMRVTDRLMVLSDKNTHHIKGDACQEDDS